MSDPIGYLKSNDASPQARRERGRWKGGAAYVSASDTIGSFHCWCGQPQGHSWPGEQEGAPHPREEIGVVQVPTKDRLEARDLRKWDTGVARMMMELVNRYGVRYRMQRDGAHVLFYPENGGRPFKAAASRTPEQQMKYLERFARENVAASQVIEASSKVLASIFNDPVEHPKREEATVTAQPVADESEELWRTIAGVDGKWKPWTGSSGRTPTSYLVNEDGDRWFCLTCDSEGKRTILDLPAQMGGHTRSNHTEDGGMWSPEARQKALETRARNKAEKAAKADLEAVTTAFEVLAKHIGVTLGDDTRVAELEKELADMTAERDNLKAKFELLRETFNL